jgi:hypothetical protein
MKRWLTGLALLAVVASQTLCGEPGSPCPACGQCRESKDGPAPCPQPPADPARCGGSIVVASPLRPAPGPTKCGAAQGPGSFQIELYADLFGLFPGFAFCAGYDPPVPPGEPGGAAQGCAAQCPEGKCCAAPAARGECCEAKGCPAKTECCEAPCCAAKSAAGGSRAAECCAKCEDAKLYAELVAIIKETESPDTFMVAVAGLMATEGHGKRAIPLVIRHAERLGVLKGIAKEAEPSPVQGLLQDYIETCMGTQANSPAADNLVPVPAPVRVLAPPPFAAEYAPVPTPPLAGPGGYRIHGVDLAPVPAPPRPAPMARPAQPPKAPADDAGAEKCEPKTKDKR